jgi:hypothetical protein
MMTTTNETIPLERVADDLVAPLWRGISSDYKHKYSYTIWQQFEDNIRSAAYTARLSLFLSKITTRLDIALAERDVERVRDVINSGQDRETLRMLREDTALLVLMVRVQSAEKFGRKRPAKTETSQRSEPGEATNEQGLSVRGSGDRSLFDQS